MDDELICKLLSQQQLKQQKNCSEVFIKEFKNKKLAHGFNHMTIS